MLVRDLAQALEEFWWCRDVATLANDGLDDDGSRVLWGGLLLKENLELVERFLNKLGGGGVRCQGMLMPIWEGRNEDTWL